MPNAGPVSFTATFTRYANAMSLGVRKNEVLLFSGSSATSPRVWTHTFTAAAGDRLDFFVGHYGSSSGGTTGLDLALSFTCACGNGVREGSEACDDGNINSNDGCSSTCTIEPFYGCSSSTPNECGQRKCYPVANSADVFSGSNPVGPFAFGIEPAGFGTFTPLSVWSPYQISGSAVLSLWSTGSPDPAIALTAMGDSMFPTGTIYMHPGPLNEPAVLRFTVPYAGAFSTVAEFLAGNTGQMNVGIRVNGVTVQTALDAGTLTHIYC